MTTMTATATIYPTRFSDEQVLRITNMAIGRFEMLGLRQLCEELAHFDDAQINDDSASLICELLTAEGHGPEADPTFTFLRGLLESPGPGEPPAQQADRLLRCAANAIALGLHLEENGWMLRTLLEDPDDGVPAEWNDLAEEVMRRARAEQA